jgi:hypothetical protein
MRHYLLLLPIFICAHAAAGDSHCTPQEKIIFFMHDCAYIEDRLAVRIAGSGAKARQPGLPFRPAQSGRAGLSAGAAEFA